AEHAAGAAASGTGLGAVPPQGVPVPAGRRARPDSGAPQAALPPALPAAGGDAAPGAQGAAGAEVVPAEGAQPTGRRRRALAAAAERAAAQEAGGARTVFALPPAEADRSPESANPANGVGVPVGPGGAVPVGPGTGAVPGAAEGQPQAVGQGAGPVQVPAQLPPTVEGAPAEDGRHDAVPLDQGADHTPPQPHPTSAPTGRRRRAVAQPAQGAQSPAEGAAPAVAPGAAQPGSAPAPAAQAAPGQLASVPAVPNPGVPGQVTPPQGVPAGTPTPGQGTPVHGIPAQGTAGQGIPVQAGPAPVPGQPVPGAQAGGSTPGQQPAVAHPAVPHPAAPVQDTAGRAVQAAPGQPVPAQPVTASSATPPAGTPGAQPLPAEAGAGPAPTAVQAAAVPQQWPGADDTSGAGTAVAQQAATPAPGTPLPAERAGLQPPQAAQPLPAEAAGVDPNSTQGRAISVRTLGQGVPFSRQAAQVQQPTATPPPHAPGGSGRRRKLGTPPEPAQRPEQQPAAAQPSLAGQSRLAPATEGAGRSYAIGAPDADAAEGPEPLDGPGGAVEIADAPLPQPLDDELPPEPLDNPRRLLVWPAPDVTTQQALSDRGYRPVIVHSREEVDAQIAAFPAALFVDPLTGPITRTALQSLRQAAVAAEVPVLVTAGLGQATREAAYGADPAVLLKALAPRDSEQHPPRVLLIEEHAEIALALTATLERRGMQVARAASDNDAVTLAGQFRPNLVVMDLMQVQRRQGGFTGIIDWLRANGQLNRTPLVVYTAAVDPADLPRLASGETVLFLAERSTSAEVQSRIVELLARIGTN
ncbi:hypothetical protein ACVB8X_01290, partial [Streptomyces sp. NRAIS4]